MAGTRPGPARRPNLQVVREGNPGHRAQADLASGLKVRPEAPPEPDWRVWFPVVKGEQKAANELARKHARETWRRIVPVLDAQGILSSLDLEVLTDLAVAVVRLRQCERDISLNGLRLVGDRGQVQNPSVVAAKKYRDQLRYLAAQFGLTPVERDFLQPPAAEGGDEADASVAASPYDV